MFEVINAKGDLLNPNSYVLVEHGDKPVCIAHGCNAQGVMGSGIAKQVKTKYPEAYTEYRRMYSAFPKGELLGRFCVANIPNSGGSSFPALNIINAVTQEFYGTDGKRYTSYDAVSEIFREIADQFSSRGVILAIPKKFASDRGGACWKTIKQLIKSELKDTNITLYIVEYQK